MKRVTLKTKAHLNALESPKIGQALAALIEQLAEIESAATGTSTLDLSISIRGSIQTDRAGAIVKAHEAVEAALSEASDESIDSDLEIHGVREPRAKAGQ